MLNTQHTGMEGQEPILDWNPFRKDHQLNLSASSRPLLAGTSTLPWRKRTPPRLDPDSPLVEAGKPHFLENVTDSGPKQKE
jgi:hypothetical protein